MKLKKITKLREVWRKEAIDKTIIIENHLEMTNQGHLGKVLVYSDCFDTNMDY